MRTTPVLKTAEDYRAEQSLGVRSRSRHCDAKQRIAASGVYFHNALRLARPQGHLSELSKTFGREVSRSRYAGVTVPIPAI